jgi:hypothetical protein
LLVVIEITGSRARAFLQLMDELAGTEKSRD